MIIVGLKGGYYTLKCSGYVADYLIVKIIFQLACFLLDCYKKQPTQSAKTRKKD